MKHLQHSLFDGFDITTNKLALNAKDFLEKLNGKYFRTAIRNSIYGVPSHPLAETKPYVFSPSIQNQRLYDKTVELLVAYLCKFWSSH